VAFGLLVHSTDRLIKYALIGTLSAVVTLWGVTIFELLNPDVRLFSSASNYIEDQQVVGVATRIGGLFVNPNANGLALVLGMFATYFFVPRGLRFLYTILVGIAVLATVSRGSIVVWVASCAVLYTMDCLRNKAKLRYISAIGFMVLLITLFLSGKTPDFLENVGMGEFLNENMKMRLAGNFFSQEDSSAETRDELATAALSQFVDSPVLGAGLGASQPIGTLGTHNLIAKIGVELGIVGVITFYFGLYFLTIFYRNYYGFWFLSVFTLASLFTHSVFEHAYFSILLVILIVLIPQNELRATGKRKRRRRKKRARRSYNIATSSEG
jgi:O-antigen ligase